jgi:hypothetical protein
MGETNSPSGDHVGYDISPLSRVKLKNYIDSPSVARGLRYFSTRELNLKF